MINRPLIALFFLVVSIAIGIFSLVYIEINCTEMIEMLDISIEYSQDDKTEAINKQLYKTVEKWEKIKPVLNLIVGQVETNQVRNDLNKAIFFFNYGDTSSMILYIEECKMDLNKIIVSNEPTITTIL